MNQERIKRKLSAILSADVAGYSRLMGEDEVSTVRTLEAYRKVISDLIEHFRGRVVDSPGDNLLAEFSSVVDAVQCAVEIHDVIKAKNEELPEDRRMLFRIGVNLGDVIEEGDRIYGDGVNIAARLEGLAEAGGICISGTAHEQIKNKLALGYEYIGEHRVKNIAEPLKVYRVPMGPKGAGSKVGDEKKPKLKNWQWTALGVVGTIIVIIIALSIWNFFSRQAPIATDVEEAPKTIAVLPFDDLSPEKDQEYFVLGLSEEILNYISNISGLHVTSKTSSFAFKDTNKTIKEIAEILDRDYILEGSVRKAGNSLRITAQLIDVVDDRHLWSETYDRELKDIFKIQKDIANNVADKLKLTLDAFQLLGGTENIEAYELYLNALGRYLIVEYDLALELIDRTIALDPGFALAWTKKGLFHLFLAQTGPVSQIPLEKSEALNAALRAIEIDPNFAEAYDILGSLRYAEGNFIEAEQAFQKGMDLRNGTIDSLLPITHYLSLGYIKKCNELVKGLLQKNPRGTIERGTYILILGCLGDLELAENEYEHGKIIFGNQWIYGNINITLIRLSKKEALSFNEIEQLNDPIWAIARENIVSPEKGLAKLRRLYSNDDNLSSAEFSNIALIAAYFGDPELSLDARKKAVRLHSMGLQFIWIPVMKEVRQLPRFKELMKEIGLLDYWKEYGWPDLCHPVGDGDFECD
jgi:adenylate cyclase